MQDAIALAQTFGDKALAADWAGADACCTAALRQRLGPAGLARAWQEVDAPLRADVPGWRPTAVHVRSMPGNAPRPGATLLTAPPRETWRAYLYLAFESTEGELACGHVLVVDEGGRLAIAHADFEVFC